MRCSLSKLDFEGEKTTFSKEKKKLYLVKPLKINKLNYEKAIHNQTKLEHQKNMIKDDTVIQKFIRLLTEKKLSNVA